MRMTDSKRSVPTSSSRGVGFGASEYGPIKIDGYEGVFWSHQWALVAEMTERLQIIQATLNMMREKLDKEG